MSQCVLLGQRNTWVHQDSVEPVRGQYLLSYLGSVVGEPQMLVKLGRRHVPTHLTRIIAS